MATKLSAYLANATDEQIEEIRKTIEEFSLIGPSVVVNENDKTNGPMKQQRILTFEEVYDKLIDYLNNHIDHSDDVIAYYFYKLGVEHGKQVEEK